MKKVIFLIAAIYIFFQLINIISHYLIFDRTSYELLYNIPVFPRGAIFPWLNFDGKNYLNIVLNGYPFGDILSVYFPLYPLLVRIFSLNLIFNPIYMGFIISITSTLIASIVLFNLVKIEFNDKIAIRSTFLLFIFPASYYFFAYYSEGLFLLLTVLVFWFIRKKNILIASIITSFATATRPFGLALIPTLLYEGYKIYHKKKKIPWEIAIAPLGFILYAIFTYLKFGDMFLMITAQSNARFGRSIDILSPYHEFRDVILKIISGPQSSYDNIFVYPVIIIEFLFG